VPRLGYAQVTGVRGDDPVSVHDGDLAVRGLLIAVEEAPECGEGAPT
jgi:hypothetical protein